MAKKAPKSKLNRKTRRVIRRSIAAVLMITAIGVAAIPVPDIQADTGVALQEETADAKRDNVESLAYNDANRKNVSYDVDSDDYLNDDLRNNLLNASNYTDPAVNEEIYTVKQLSNGMWKYHLQFKYYLVTNETITTELDKEYTVSGAIISKYNDAYEEEIVEIQAVNPVKYYEVSVEEYNEFYFDPKADDNPDNDSDTPGVGCTTYTLSYEDYKNYKTNSTWGDKQKDYDFLHYYFNTEYLSSEKEWSDYYKKEIAADGGIVEGDSVPNPISKNPKINFTTTEELYKYYCDYHFASNEPIANKGALTLVYALDGNNSDSVTSNYIYLVRLVNGKSQNDLLTGFADENGFISKDQSKDIIGIANGAFKDVTAIDTLVLPSEIRYIGDNAFEGSFIQNISLSNVSDIGNCTFKNCSELKNVTFGSAVNVIGTEAFSGSALTNIVLPYSVKKIGAGAFSYCYMLESVDLSALKSGNAEEVTIGKYAFFDCYGLDNVNFGEMCGITEIGDGAFATKQTGTANTQGTWKSVVLPSQISSGKLGDWLFAGRATMESVTFPANYGYTDDAEIPVNMFKGCTNLKEVIFPETCARVTYKPYLFLDVINSEFFVSGPANNGSSEAEPRKATWAAISAVSEYIPYRYKDSKTGLEYYEISDGLYLLTANSQGVLTSCKLVPGSYIPSTGIPVTVPDYVGHFKINSLASDCFDEELKDDILVLTIKDNSISEISDSTFSGCSKLQKVIVGNSVNKIGANAFASCPNLTEVVFNTPTNGYAGFTIGTDAFNTGSNKLTFTGDIVDGYAPFEWAMSPDSYVDKTSGTRVCYKSNSPSNLTVLYNNTTGERTLVDYPKYVDLDDDNTAAINTIQNAFYTQYGEAEVSAKGYGDKQEKFLKAWENACASGTESSVYNDPDLYGPWVYEGWIEGREWVNADDQPISEPIPYCTDTIDVSDYKDERSNFLAAWKEACAGGVSTDAPEHPYNGELYGPWVTAAWINDDSTWEEFNGTSWITWSGDKPEPYFDRNPYSIIKCNENEEWQSAKEWQVLTPLAESLVNSTLKIVVPAGVDSVDVKSYIDDKSNSSNVLKYLKGIAPESYGMYTTSEWDKDNPQEEGAYKICNPGLFSGYYVDFTGDEEERKFRGNDRVEEIVLESVKSLPDYAFDSCENLQKVTIGPDCKDIGTAPFRGCDNLSEVVFNNNNKYTSNKAIIYSVNDDGTYTIEECLSYRGLDSTIAPSVVSLANDPDLANVSAIKDGAFEDCNYISAVDLRDTSKTVPLTDIPNDAFKNCKLLTQVYLPQSVNSIKEGAFLYDFGEDNPSRITATIPGKEVHIATNAFNHDPTVTIRSYKDSAAFEYAEYHSLGWEDLAKTFQVVFLDHDGTQIGDIQYIEEGKSAEPPADPVREGYTFVGWSEDYNGISKDTILVAQYQQEGAGDDGTGGNGGNGGTGGNGGNTDTDGDGIVDSDGKMYTVMVIKGDGAGTYLSGTTVKIIADEPSAGQRFSHWSSSDGVAFANNNSATTTFTMPTKNVTVTANYNTKSTGGSGTGGNTTSGNNNKDESETKVTINKPGFSHTDISSAIVNGSPDNFIVKISETAAATQAVEKALTAEYGSLENIQYFPMDITLWDASGTTKITDTTGLTVDITIPLPDSLVKYSGNNKAAGVVNDRLDKLSVKFTTIDGVPCVTFRATHFSPYVIYVDTSNLTADTVLDSTPQTGDGIHPKWFLAIGLACISIILFLKKDKVQPARKTSMA